MPLDDNDVHLEPHQIGCQTWQLIVPVRRPAVFDPQVLALDIAEVAELLTEGVERLRER
jgi:hypothetical protein